MDGLLGLIFGVALLIFLFYVFTGVEL